MEYLKDNQYYIDRYDLATIQECLEMTDVCAKAYAGGLKKVGAEGLSKGEFAKTSNWYTNQILFHIKAERYRHKEETIENWILKDQLKQGKYDNTLEPQRILCPDCKRLMHVRLKHLDSLDDPLRMMFLFECSLCKKRKWIYEDGIERESTPILCPNCKKETEMSAVKEGKNKVIWKTTCTFCGFSETIVDDFEKDKFNREKQEEKDKKLLEEYREQFCSDKVGKEALDYVDALPVASEIYEEELKKFDSQAYQKVVKLKKLSVIDLEKLLKKIFEKEEYINLYFDKPEIGQYVIVTFSAQDANSSRKQDASISNLQKIIKDELERTNWRLMIGSISYRLGYLSGRLKGYEREEDFFEISGERREEKPSKIDYETRMKHEGYHVVQLAKLMDKFKGIENVRKRRLTKEPDGFFLEADEGPYTCGICGENRYGNEIWWNLDGIRCADCWRNIKEGVIPSLKNRYDSNSVYFQNWQLSSDTHFGIHPSTARKLRRQGLLHGRDLKREDGTVYYTIYLNEENKEFLEKYPQKERAKWVITDLLGEKVEI